MLLDIFLVFGFFLNRINGYQNASVWNIPQIAPVIKPLSLLLPSDASEKEEPSLKDFIIVYDAYLSALIGIDNRIGDKTVFRAMFGMSEKNLSALFGMLRSRLAVLCKLSVTPRKIVATTHADSNPVNALCLFFM